MPILTPVWNEPPCVHRSAIHLALKSTCRSGLSLLNESKNSLTFPYTVITWSSALRALQRLSVSNNVQSSLVATSLKPLITSRYCS